MPPTGLDILDFGETLSTGVVQLGQLTDSRHDRAVSARASPPPPPAVGRSPRN